MSHAVTVKQYDSCFNCDNVTDYDSRSNSDAYYTLFTMVPT
jgi:hypothetical protein